MEVTKEMVSNIAEQVMREYAFALSDIIAERVTEEIRLRKEEEYSELQVINAYEY